MHLTTLKATNSVSPSHHVLNHIVQHFEIHSTATEGNLGLTFFRLTGFRDSGTIQRIYVSAFFFIYSYITNYTLYVHEPTRRSRQHKHNLLSQRHRQYIFRCITDRKYYFGAFTTRDQ